MLRFFSQRLSFRLGISVMLIELIFMSVIGVIYFNRFAAQIDQRQVERLQIATEVLMQNQLNLTSLSDRKAMSQLVGEEIKNAMLIVDENSVAFSLNPEYRRMAVEDIPFLDKEDLSFDHPAPILKRVEIEGQPYLVNITPFYGSDRIKFILYFRTGVAGAEQEKANVIILLLVGFAVTGVATSIVLMLVLNRTVLARVGKLAQMVSQVEEGDFTVRADTNGTGPGAEDEITVLQQGFNAMVERLQGFIATLEQKVAERTHALSESNEQLQQAKVHAEEARRLAEAANRAKSVFLANMSHELRTPLNAVLGFSQVMKNSPDVTSSQVENLNIISRSGEHLLNLINNVLDMSKIESGRVELEETAVDLYQLLEETRLMMSVRAQEKGLDFTLQQSADIPRHILVDASKLRQILLNLIGNAIKYTTSGSVMLRALVEAKQDSTPTRLRFEVEDSGPGIRQEDRLRMFSPFVQLEDRAPNEVGTGLGLAIGKQYVELMGGTIGVASELGKGSVFHFEIPVVVVAAETTSVEPRRGRVIGLAAGQASKRLLIAEDQPENRLLLHKLLAPVGFDLREAVNGQEAVELFSQWHPHLVFMDIRMPVMNGLEATRLIKASAEGAQTRVVALTAHALEEERREIRAAGCDDLIRKPYTQSEIFDALIRHLGVRFRYEEDNTAVAAEVALDEAALAGLPDELQNSLEQALVRLDIKAVSRAIEEISAHDSSLAEALAVEAGNLQFGRILQLIRVNPNRTVTEKQI